VLVFAAAASTDAVGEEERERRKERGERLL
jgi:hypothetical protein